jgi:hypothetical protein
MPRWSSASSSPAGSGISCTAVSAIARPSSTTSGDAWSSRRREPICITSASAISAATTA